MDVALDTYISKQANPNRAGWQFVENDRRHCLREQEEEHHVKPEQFPFYRPWRPDHRGSEVNRGAGFTSGVKSGKGFRKESMGGSTR